MLAYAVWGVLFLAAWLNQGLLSAVVFMVIYLGVTVVVALIITPAETVVSNLLFLDWYHLWHGESALSPREAAKMVGGDVGSVAVHKQKRMAYKMAVGRAFGWVGLTVLAL